MGANQLAAALALRDLSDPAGGRHAMQQVVAAITGALSAAWAVPVRRDPGPRLVPVADNYDRLGYAPDAITRDRRYTRYAGAGRMLRSHTSARIPALLRALAAEPDPPADLLLAVPGICYRRDEIDRQHVGEPHQLDLWRIRPRGPALTDDDLSDLVRLVVGAVLPGQAIDTVPAVHPYTEAGLEVRVGGVEVGECGLAHPAVLVGAGLAETASGLAMGLGLDRLTMLIKEVPDIRLLRSTDPRIAGQMLDLARYRAVSTMPAARRDLSIAVADDLDPELLGDRVREILGPDADAVEQVRVLSRTPYVALPDAARQRMGLHPGQQNVLLRLVLRDLSRTLTAARANELRDRVYAQLHAGAAREWAGAAHPRRGGRPDRPVGAGPDGAGPDRAAGGCPGPG
jgi:phenylalanyl-tRNA synthetase alpha chain